MPTSSSQQQPGTPPPSSSLAAGALSVGSQEGVATLGSASIGSGSFTSSPTGGGGVGDRQFNMGMAIAAAKSAATMATASQFPPLPSSWPETSSASLGGGAVYPTQQPPPSIPILRNSSHNSAASSNSASLTPGLSQSISLTTNPSSEQQDGAPRSVDSSVLLGLEELERQQAYAEKKKAEQRRVEMMNTPSGPRSSSSLPPLAPTAPSSSAKLAIPHNNRQQQITMVQQQQYSSNQVPPRLQYQQQQQQHYYQYSPQHQPQLNYPPTQISYNYIDTETDDPTSLSSIENRSKEGDTTQTSNTTFSINSTSSNTNMKRVTSIEKFQKSAQNTLRRFRSWSMSDNNNNYYRNSSSDNLGRSERETTGGNGSEHESSERGFATISSTPPLLKSSSRQRSAPSLLTTPIPGLNPSPPPNNNNATSTPISSSSPRINRISEPYLDEDELTPLIYGYLHKLGRNGHWQKRFFELTDGERLTYYKSGKRQKILATLDLCKVGEIAIDKTDPEECTFTIQVSNRPYYLRAETKARCNDWVIILNRAREARHGWGNIQLVNPTLEDVAGMAGGGLGGGSRSQAGSDEFGPCIVISALRPRTQAVNYDDLADDNNAVLLRPDLLLEVGGGVDGGDNEQIEVLDGRDQQLQHRQRLQFEMEDDDQQRQGRGGPPVMAKWQKRHSALHHLSMRVLDWARSITSNADACRKQKDVVVVPAHVMRSMMSNQSAGTTRPGRTRASTGGGESSTAPPGYINVTRPSVSGKPKGLHDVVEETPSKETIDSDSERERTGSSEDSPAYGMGSSQYV